MKINLDEEIKKFEKSKAKEKWIDLPKGCAVRLIKNDKGGVTTQYLKDIGGVTKDGRIKLDKEAEKYLEQL